MAELINYKFLQYREKFQIGLSVKYLGMFCPAVGGSGVSVVRYQLHLRFAFTCVGRAPRNMNNYSRVSCIEKKRVGKRCYRLTRLSIFLFVF